MQIEFHAGGLVANFPPRSCSCREIALEPGEPRKTGLGNGPQLSHWRKKKEVERKTTAETSTLKPSLSLETLPGAARLISKPQTGLQLWLA